MTWGSWKGRKPIGLFFCHKAVCTLAIGGALLYYHSSLAVPKKKCDQQLAALSEKWDRTAETIKRIKEKVKENDSTAHNIATALLAREFILLEGEPGGAKSLIARLFLESELSGISPEEFKIFQLQFHQLIQEGKITGFPVVKDYLQGRFEVNTEDSLVGPKFALALFDEMEKALPSVTTKLLSVLAERKALHGNKVIDAVLRAGIATSNSTLAEFRESFEDKSTADAILDRFGLKHSVGNKIVSDEAFLSVLEKRGLVPEDPFKPESPNKGNPAEMTTHLTEFHDLISKVEIPDSLIDSIAKAHFDFDVLETQANDAQVDHDYLDIPPVFSANQGTRRSLKKLVLKSLAARFLVDQLVNGVPFEKLRMTMEPKDLIHLQSGIILGGPGELKLSEDGKSIIDDGLLDRYLSLPHLDEHERRELEAIKAKRRTLVSILEKHLGGKSKETKTQSSSTPQSSYTPPKKPSAKDRNLEFAYNETQRGLQALREYLGAPMDYVVRELAETVVDGTNASLFGGPGSAKSLSSTLVATAEQRGRRLWSDKTHTLPDRLFIEQLDKQTPEGKFTGFRDYSKTMEKGRDVYNREGSLSDPKNFGAILDEYASGHSGSLAQLLSLANPEERAVLNGEGGKTNLGFMFMTMNAYPSQLLDKFAPANAPASEITKRKTGSALHDRTIHKAWVVNKGMTPEEDAEFLKRMKANPAAPDVTTFLFELREMAKSVKIRPEVVTLAREIDRQCHAKRLALKNQTLQAHVEDPGGKVYPTYYLPASSGSARSEILNLEAARASFIVKQLMEGVPYDQLRLEMDFRDLPLLSKATMYATPVQFDVVGSPNDATFKVEKVGELPSGEGLNRLDRIAREYRNYFDFEQNSYVDTANEVIAKELDRWKKTVANFNDLIPEIKLMR
ncbi:MAG: AAA family ATPase, partial [Pseudomonadota bacterium]